MTRLEITEEEYKNLKEYKGDEKLEKFMDDYYIFAVTGLGINIQMNICSELSIPSGSRIRPFIKTFYFNIDPNTEGRQKITRELYSIKYRRYYRESWLDILTNIDPIKAKEIKENIEDYSAQDLELTVNTIMVKLIRKRYEEI